MIYRNLFVLFCITITLIGIPSHSFQKASIRYDDGVVDYSVLNKNTIQKQADSFFDKYENTGDKQYITTAIAKYYTLVKIEPNNIYYNTQLARGYAEINEHRLSKKYFNICITIDKNNPYANYYFGEFYFKQNDFKRALRYFKIAYNNGYKNNYDLVLQMAVIYEKLADLLQAKDFYQKASALNKQDTKSKNKITEINNLNYGNSGYYKADKK